MTYDANRYWVSQITAAALNLTYQYDAVGNVEAILDPDPRFGNQTFTYDALDRLKTINGPYGPATYQYDAHGNRQDGFTYDPANRFRLTNIVNGPSFAYDNNGNMTGPQGAPVYFYTPDNLLDRTTASGETTRFVYDADEWRLKKATDNGPATYYVRGPNGQLLSEWTTSPAVARDYIYAGSRLIAAVESATPLPGSTPPPGTGSTFHQITLASWAGRYVTAEDYGDHPIFANRPAALGWEQFTLVDVNGGDLLDNDYVFLRADQWQRYVKAVGGGGGTVEASATVPAAWETFRIRRVGGSGPITLGTQVAFSSETGHYLKVEYPVGGSVPASVITATATNTVMEAVFTLGNGGALSSVLAPGEQLQADGYRASPNGRYRLVYQGSDGNLVLYDTQPSQWAVVWNANTTSSAGTVTMEASGNLVVRDASDIVRCDTQQEGWGNAGLYLNVADDGSVRIHAGDGTENRRSPNSAYPVCTAP